MSSNVPQTPAHEGEPQQPDTTPSVERIIADVPQTPFVPMQSGHQQLDSMAQEREELRQRREIEALRKELATLRKESRNRKGKEHTTEAAEAESSMQTSSDDVEFLRSISHERRESQPASSTTKPQKRANLERNIEKTLALKIQEELHQIDDVRALYNIYNNIQAAKERISRKRQRTERDQPDNDIGSNSEIEGEDEVDMALHPVTPGELITPYSLIIGGQTERRGVKISNLANVSTISGVMNARNITHEGYIKRKHTTYGPDPSVSTRGREAPTLNTNNALISAGAVLRDAQHDIEVVRDVHKIGPPLVPTQNNIIEPVRLIVTENHDAHEGGSRTFNANISQYNANIRRKKRKREERNNRNDNKTKIRTTYSASTSSNCNFEFPEEANQSLIQIEGKNKGKDREKSPREKEIEELPKKADKGQMEKLPYNPKVLKYRQQMIKQRLMIAQLLKNLGKLQTFNPKKDTKNDIEILITSIYALEKECQRLNIPSEEIMGIVQTKIAKAMSGDAAKWWNSLSEQDISFKNLSDVIDKLRDRWGKVMHSLDIDRKLAEVKQGENTKIDEYADNFYQRAKEGGVRDCTPYIPVFIRGLYEARTREKAGEWVGKKMAQKKEREVVWATLIKKIIEWERYIPKTINESKPTTSTPTHNAAIDSSNTDIKELLQLLLKKDTLAPIQATTTPTATTTAATAPNNNGDKCAAHPMSNHSDKDCNRHKPSYHRGFPVRGRGFRGRGRGRNGGQRLMDTSVDGATTTSVTSFNTGGNVTISASTLAKLLQGNNPNTGGGYQGTCYTCHRVGHKAAECPTNNKQDDILKLLSELANKQNNNYELSKFLGEIPPTPKYTHKERMGAIDINSKKRPRRVMQRNSIKIRSNKYSRTDLEAQNSTKTLEKEEKETKFEGAEEDKSGNNQNTVATMHIHAENDIDDVTAAYTVTTIDNKPVRTLVDSGANRSCVSAHLVQYLKYQDRVIPLNEQILDAQKQAMQLQGTVILPVKFGSKIYNWRFRVMNTLIAPLIIGTDVFQTMGGQIHFTKRFVKIAEDKQLIALTLNEHKQSTVIAMVNRTIAPNEIMEVTGELIHNDINHIPVKHKKKRNIYVVNTGGVFINDQLVESTATYTKQSGNSHEYIKVRACNNSNKSKQIKKGDIIATVDCLSDNKYEFSNDIGCTDNTLSHINSTSLAKAKLACITYIKAKTNTKRAQGDSLNEGGPSMTKERGGNLDFTSSVQITEITHLSNSQREVPSSGSKLDRGGLLTQVGTLDQSKANKGRVLNHLIDPEAVISEMETSVVPQRQAKNSIQIMESYTSQNNQCQSVEDCQMMGKLNPSSEIFFVSSKAKDAIAEMEDEGGACVLLNKFKIAPTGGDEIGVLPTLAPLPEGSTNNDNVIANAQKNRGISEEDVEKMMAKIEIPNEYKDKVKGLITEYKEIFAHNLSAEFTGGNSYFSPHIIRLTPEHPSLWTPQFRLGYKEEQMVVELNDKQLKQGVIEETIDNEYNSPVMVVPKKDGSWRPVIDFRNINKHTVRENWSFPKIEEAIDALHGAKYMSTIDLTSGYWQIPLHPNSRKYTAYTLKKGRFQYKTLPMGITNAAPTFQRNMEMVFKGLLWKCCIVYIDDVIIYSRTLKEHLQSLNEVFKRLKQYNMVIKPDKCFLFKKEVEYLGHVVGRGQVKPAEHNIRKIKMAKIPTTLEEVRSFTMLASYYRKFIKGFAKIAQPLTEIMKLKGRKTKVSLNEAQIEAFNQLKEKLASEPVLQMPDFTKPFHVRTDASNYAIGGVLFQYNEAKQERPIYFGSRVLSKTERNYSASEREMLAIEYFIKYWRPYLWGTTFQVFTDHSPLRGIKTDKDLTRRLTRMILKLQEYDFKLLYTPGKENVVADAMSRNPIANVEDISINMVNSIQIERGEKEKEEAILEEITALEMGIYCNSINSSKRQKKKVKGKQALTLSQKQKAVKCQNKLIKQNKVAKFTGEQIAKMQLEDETLQQCIQTAQKDKTAKTWTVIEGCLHHVRFQRHSGKKSIQLVLPLSLREEVMEAFHDDLLGGHCGYFKTAQKVAQWYWWPRMNKDIKKWVKECIVCQKHTRDYGPKLGKLAPIIATRPFQIMGMDILTELPTTESGNKHIIVFTDYFTKWVEAFAIPDRTATTLAVKLIQGVLCRHGAPERIISDRDSSFVADVFKEVTEMLNIKQSMTTAYNPQADGQAEKTVGTLHNTLSKMVNNNQNNWDTLIPYALWAYRTAVHATTKETPYFLVYGRDPVNPVDVRIKQWVETHPNMEKFTQTTIDRLIKARDRVIKTTKMNKEAMKNKYDKNKKDNPFNKGDLVWLKNMKKTPTENRKLKAKFEGPYIIINRIEKGDHQLNVDIQHTNDSNDKQRVSIRRLKRAYVRPSLAIEYTKTLPEETLIEVPEQNIENSKQKEEITSTQQPRKVKNKKGRNIWTQQRREKKLKKENDIRDEWEVEDIVGVRTNRKLKRKEYEVKWVGYSKTTWEPIEHLKNAQRKVRDFIARNKLIIKANKK